MKNIQTIISVLFILVFAITAKSQQDDEGTELLKPFRAKLAESVKKNSLPILPALDTTDSKISYDVPEHIIAVKYPDPVIRPLAMSVEKTEPAMSFFAKAGFGYPISPNIELSYHNKENKNLKFSTNFDHLSSQGNVSNQSFGKTHFDLGATYFTESGLAVGSKLGFNLDAYRYYGHNKLSEILPDSLDIFPDSADVPKDSVSQRFFEFFGNVHFYNAKPNDMQLNYRFDADFYVMNDKYDASEFGFLPKLSVDKWLGSPRQRQKHRIFADLNANVSSFNNDSTGNLRSLVNFHPGTDLNFGAFKTTLAVNLGSSEGKFFILPDLKLSLGIAEGMFNIYAGWNGQMKTNTFRSLSLYTPFISSELELRHTRYNDIFAGLTGNIKGIGYDLRASYVMARNLPLFINDSTQNYLRFNLLYDTLSIVSFKGSVNAKIAKELTAMVGLGYNIYTGGTFSSAYHLPVFESNFSLIYNLKPLLVKAEFYFNSGVSYIDVLTKTDKTLNGLFDINLQASYWFGKEKQNIGAFIELNNLLNNKNQRWYLYPQIGFNARAGVLVKF